MPFFQSKQTISLSAEEGEENSGRPALYKRSSSRWFIPCCSPASFLTSQTGAIQLPEDPSDSEDEQPLPHSISNYQELPAPSKNVFLQNQNNLSRNPFARASDASPSRIENGPKSTQEFVNETLSVTEEEEEVITEAAEELADVSAFDASKYENEPDWTEVYEEEEEEALVDTASSDTQIKTFPKVEEKVPQIEVLHHLPLTRLSKEIPPALIHEHQKSMYGEESVLSPTNENADANHLIHINTSEQRTRLNNRFSMPEEDYQALRKEGERQKRSSGTISEPLSFDHTVSAQSEVSKPMTEQTSTSVEAGSSLVNKRPDDPLTSVEMESD
ncbi:hypothetical protein A0J61_08262 [Choanephora cucurbitarum]|uniref:Uncharacterized protein n=1 Tax=Choanephora cucurbitarum TaxID=101091 RepID=A0A1C7N3P6_9FUNG|nr:hypothetical protein A0J61_08262 [Choanephora cucurbitarum]